MKKNDAVYINSGRMGRSCQLEIKKRNKIPAGEISTCESRDKGLLRNLVNSGKRLLCVKEREDGIFLY